MRNLIQIPANKTFEVLLALNQALEGGDAVFVGKPEVNGIAEVEDLPKEVSDETAVVIKSSGSTGTPKRSATKQRLLSSQAVRLAPQS